MEVAGGERPGEEDDDVGVDDADEGDELMMMSMKIIIEMSIMFLMLMLNVRNRGSSCRRATRLCSNGN